MGRTVHLPYVLEQERDGTWCGEAALRPGSSAFGYGDDPESALADLKEKATALIEQSGPPQQLTMTVTVTCAPDDHTH
ncbi:hypothetical protein [Nocardiopsis halophila]|uniref:hypothetical protein n=1 Tax=Nocardiopsis halophila TaxID=141692 RepID=UPI0005858B92|nr:hypothetical protein [Nocardiopsis halophila]